MTDTDPTHRDDVIQQMVRTVLNDILASVIAEFEQATGSEIGPVRIGGKDSITGHRSANIEILRASPESLAGLMQYKKILCDHEPLRRSDFCVRGNLDD